MNPVDMVMVSVIVVNYNGGELIKKCLESIFKQKAYFGYEVIVVDNASSDGSRVHIAKFSGVKLIANEENRGFGRANNQAIRASFSPYILLLNNDASLIGEDFLEKAVQFMDKREDCAAIGPEILSPDGKVQNPYYASFPNLATEFLSLSGLLPAYNFLNRGIFYTREGLAHHTEGSKEIAAAHLCGACMILRRKALEDAGLFDERMFFYREDMDLSFRLREKGWMLFVLPYIGAIHIGAGSWKDASFSISRESIKSIYIFFKKNYGRRRYWSLRIIHFSAAFFRLLAYPFLRILAKSSPRALLYYQDLFRQSLLGISNGQ